MNMESISEFFLKVKDAWMNFGIVDAFDILLVTVFVYVIIKQLRRSQSIQIIKGIVAIALLYVVVLFTGMEASKFLFKKVLTDIIVVFAIIFSPELRQGLEGLGKGKLGKRIFGASPSVSSEAVIDEIVKAADRMSKSKVGSLIIIQRSSLLGDLVKNASILDCNIKDEILCSIFYPKAPLHDGAVIIKDDKIHAARCVVPLSNKRDIGQGLGTRHRAAVEVTMHSDAIVVVTSEEKGTISIALDGKLYRGITSEKLSEMLRENLCGYTGIAQNVKKKKKSDVEAEQSTLRIDDIVLPGEEVAETPANDENRQLQSGIINEGAQNNEQE